MSYPFILSLMSDYLLKHQLKLHDRRKRTYSDTFKQTAAQITFT